jgi:prefoldin subunit 4
MELELADESDQIPYKLATTFFTLTPAQAIKQLSSERKLLDKEIKKLETRKEECVGGMKKLKVELYAKFGTQINLETDPKED